MTCSSHKACKALFLILFIALFSLGNALAQTPQCNDGSDNDGDGRIDYLIENKNTTGGGSQVFGYYNGLPHPYHLVNQVRNSIINKGIQLNHPTVPFIAKDGTSGGGTQWNLSSGTFHAPTLEMICASLGYYNWSNVTFLDQERSSRYPSGKANFHSPHNNHLTRFRNGNFYQESAEPKFGKMWVATIRCTTPRPACNDLRDNDGDGLVDLNDPGCATKYDISELMHDDDCSGPTDDSEDSDRGECNDGQDNDGDGYVDLADPGCSGPNDPSERGNTQCDNGQDDDGDGKVDLADPGCSSPADNSEDSDNGECNDGQDNDGDGLTDTADPGCTGPNDPSERGDTECDNGQDDDGDGKVDLNDPGCSSPSDDSEHSDGGGGNECKDGIDNDNDGVTDTDDPGCFGDPNHPTEGKPDPECNDGIDNDNNGVTDFPQDDGCVSLVDNDESGGTGGNNDPACSDGVDNDHDGATDYPADPGCSSAHDDSELGNTECDDGQDNDGDGDVDSADADCSGPSDDKESPDSVPECRDSVDNDGDSYVDLADPGCEDADDTSETSSVECDNGLDDDGDGDIDTADSDCSGPTDPEEGSAPECDDGIDNDNDGKIDLEDVDCTDAQDDSEAGSGGGNEKRVQPLHECNLQTFDGGFISFFSAINNNDSAVTIPIGKSANGVNEFIEPSGEGIDQGQVEHFPTGYTGGLFSTVIWPNDRFTWYLQYKNSRGDAVSTEPGSVRCASLEPVLNCVANLGGGNYQARFGYQNNSYFGMPVPASEYNSLSGGTPVDPQPERFESGRFNNVFRVNFDGNPITWTLVNSTVTASSASNSCGGNRVICNGIDCANSCLETDTSEMKTKLKRSVSRYKKVLRTMGVHKKDARRFVRKLQRKVRAQMKRIADSVVNCNQYEHCQNTDNQDAIDALSKLMKKAYEQAGNMIDDIAKTAQRAATGHGRIAKLLDSSESHLRGIPRVHSVCE